MLIGIGVLILLGDGVVAGVLLNRSKAQNSGWIVITFGWGMAVLFGVWTSVAMGGQGDINPAVTIAKWASSRALFDPAVGGGFTQMVLQVAGEFVGAFAGAVLVYLAYINHWSETEDPGLKLAVFSTGPAVRNYAANFITEVIGTAMLLFGVFGIFVAGGGTSVAGTTLALNVFWVALLVFSIGMSLGGPTGYAINPARDLGPRIIHAILPIPGKGTSEWEYSWVPVLGPIVGGILGAWLARAVFL
ncbi:MAG TPA: MIP/aquaporin family protein [Actinomycetota bacterium]|nr:MIP/aquaporin family protein [Actinomycetota bacterium]